jgi:hypothetical protein
VGFGLLPGAGFGLEEGVADAGDPGRGQGSRHLYAGRRSSSKQVPLELILASI